MWIYWSARNFWFWMSALLQSIWNQSDKHSLQPSWFWCNTATSTGSNACPTWGNIPSPHGTAIGLCGQTLSVVTLADMNSRLMTFPYAYFEEKPAPLNGLEIEGSQWGSSICISNWQSIHLLTINFCWLWIILILHFSGLLQLIRCGNYSMFYHYHWQEHATRWPSLCLFHAFEWHCDHLVFTVIAHDQVPFLRLQIQQYFEQFTSLYPHRPLTPKCHYLVHIPTLIERFDYLLYIIMCTAFV